MLFTICSLAMSLISTTRKSEEQIKLIIGDLYWKELKKKFADNLVNLQAGFQIDECWTPLLRKLYPGKNSGSDSYDA